jgi:superfamily II DNA/RNA helicase
MSIVFDRLVALLADSTPDYPAFRRELQPIIDVLTEDERVRSRVILRLSRALQDFAEHDAGTGDVAVLLRQVIRIYERRLPIPQSLWQLLSSRRDEFHLRVVELKGDTVTLVADAWQPRWLPAAAEIDQLQGRRVDALVIGDGSLYAMSGRPTYQSAAQRAAVHACLFAAPGATHLITLPTGAGKSMCIQLPAWVDSHGGRKAGGTTVVVVPTISLALDQERQARTYFSDAAGPEYSPQSQIGDTSADIRHMIERGLQAGTLPILYLSPEALLQSNLRNVCLEAARAGTLKRLVVDEAHLVESWGAGFRTDFQHLAAYRKELLAASGGRLRTLLLSATVSRECENLLKKLFAEEALAYVQANRLRPEPAYWFDHCVDPTTRRSHVLEALHHLPRPAILYVTRPQDAKDWVALLQNEGFQRVAAYSGDTDADERRRLISEWNADKRDVMVATTAFGVGIDKRDVRTVIHACLPENLDRFYQEVGRTGRDGYSSISLLCTASGNARSPGDEDLAFSMTRTAVITTQKALDRWRGMKARMRYWDDRGDHWLVDLDAPPYSNPEMAQSDANREWNDHTLLLMQRAGLIRIVDSMDMPHRSTAERAETLDQGNWRAIELGQNLIRSNELAWGALLDQTRETEKAQVQGALRNIRTIAEHGAAAKLTSCLAHWLADLYPATARACGGCPACRQARRLPYAESLPLYVDVPIGPAHAMHLQGELRTRLGARGVLKVLWDGPRTIDTLYTWRDLLADLVGAGCQQFVLPAPLLGNVAWAQELVQGAAQYPTVAHRFLSAAEIKAHDLPLYAVPTVIVYPPDDGDAGQLYTHLRTHGFANTDNVPQIHFVHRALYLASEHGLFMDRINGIPIYVDELRDLVAHRHGPDLLC